MVKPYTMGPTAERCRAVRTAPTGIPSMSRCGVASRCAHMPMNASPITTIVAL